MEGGKYWGRNTKRGGHWMKRKLNEKDIERGIQREERGRGKL